ncbi:transcription repressor OFP7-like [Iris pallida]|uniref:Transcription repressor n=1 Tax=Iris pallida TaxID=29817 RepID=A0AAX6E5U8_IRIPA|nr:transcription repressor OFP7-like [Iris pallida]
MESKSRLKQRLARLFQSSTAPLLRAPCNHSATSRSIFSSSSAAGSTSSRRSASTDIVVDPVFLVRRNGATSSSTPPPPFLTGKVDRSLSLPLSLPAGLDCGGCRPAARTASERDLAKNIHKKKKDYGVAGVAEGNACPPASPSSPKKIQLRSVNNRADQDQKNKTPTPTTTKKKSRRKKKLLSNGYGFSSSSSSEEFEFSSSDDEDDEEEADSNFFSSRSFSSDSSGFYRRPSSNRNRTKKKKEKEKKKLSGRPPRHSRDGFQPVISVVPSKKKVEEEEEEEEEKSGFPVTKRSKDPYADFRDSMVEMIVERQMFGAKDLEQLLRSYLSLNSPHHHPVILRAFADISEVLFGH